MKPRIVLVRFFGGASRWRCSATNGCGFGSTVEEAYHDYIFWKRRTK